MTEQVAMHPHPNDRVLSIDVYSKPNCPWCDQAKALLKSRGWKYNTINLDVGQERVEEEAYISRDELFARLPGVRTLPQIIVSGERIGGFAELKAYIQQHA